LGIEFEEKIYFDRNKGSNELMDLSETYTIYGLCDESFIVCSGEMAEFYGEVYKLRNRNMERV